MQEQLQNCWIKIKIIIKKKVMTHMSNGHMTLNPSRPNHERKTHRSEQRKRVQSYSHVIYKK